MKHLLLTMIAAVALLLPLGSEGLEPAAVADGSYRSPCLDCHDLPRDLSHPVGVTAPPVPGLPLGAAGGILCTTCHDVPSAHRETHGRSGLVQLRLPESELCAACHSGGSTQALHAQAMGRAHLMSSQDEELWGGFDAESRSCLSCHDGSTASAASTMSGIPGAGAHPIGVPYVEGRSNSWSEGVLRPIPSLPVGIRLFNGQVGCGSCHSLYAPGDDFLIVDMWESRLCLTCHDI